MFISPDFPSRVTSQMVKVDKLLVELKDVLVNPVVAGGAPRDWFFQQLCRDVDIFVDPQDVQGIVTFAENCQHFSHKTKEDLPPHYRSEYISSVTSFGYCGLLFQIIVKESKRSVILDFPCSLSCITYEKFCIKPSNIFMQTISSQTLYFTDNCNVGYMKKVLKYFDRYSVKIFTPQLFLQMITRGANDRPHDF